MADEGDVGRAADAHEPRRGAAVADAVEERREHVGVRQAVDRLAERVAEGGADRDDDLVGLDADARLPELAQERLRGRRGAEQPRVDRVRQPPQQLPALAVEAVAGAGAAVVVRRVDRRGDRAVGTDHRRPSAGSPPPRAGAASRRPPPRRRAKPRRSSARATSRPLIPSARTRSAASDVGGTVAVGQVARVEAARREPHLLVRHRRKAELGEHRLHRPRAARSRTATVVGLPERLDPRVHLPVALDRQPLVVVVRVVVAAAEHVVVARHRRVART